MKERLIISVAVVAVLAALVSACGGSDDSGGGAELAEGEVFTLGYAASQTGRLTFYEETFQKGLEAELAQINDEGGVDGKVPIELEVRDGASDPQRTGVAAQELVDEGAQFLISPCDVDTSLPAAQIAQRAGVGIISSCGSASSFREQIGESAFLNVYGTVAEGQAMAEFAIDEGYETAGVLVSSDLEYTQSITETAADRFSELGGEVVETQQYKISQPRYQTQATAVANANPDVVLTSMFLPDSNAFLRDLRAAGYDGPVIGSDGMQGDETLAARSAAENVYVMTFGYPGTGPENTTDKFYDLYEQEYGEPPESSMAALGADLAFLLEAAISEAGTTEPTAVRDAFNELEGVLGATGEISYSGQDGIPAKDVIILKTDIEANDYEFIDRFVPEAAVGTG